MEKLKPVLNTAPAADLISLADARAHVRRDDTDDDTYISSLIAVAMAHLDGANGVLNRALINQTWTETADEFPVGDEFRLNLSPVVSISSIQYYDANNALQTFASSNYSVHNGIHYAYVKLASDASWPSTYDRDDAVSVQGVFGYGSAAENVPAVIKHAGLMLLAHWYENREAVLVGTTAAELPAGVMRLLRPYIRPHF